jgi:glycosyltransferase involved in cell wall biosynthesis
MMLRRYVKERNLERNVIFAGHVNGELMRDLYSACDLLLHPIKSQGGWLAPFEALCAGKVIVVSTEMTASDLIKKERIGIVTNNFTEAVWNIYNEPSKYIKMAQRGQIWVKNNLSWKRFCQKMVDLFYRVVGG